MRKYSTLQIAARYLRYYFTSSNGKGHGIHSPFIFEFITRVLNDTTSYPEYKKVEGLRKQLLNDSRMFIIEDFGAGSDILKKYERSISSIARNAAKSIKYGQLLFRMVKYYKPATILELGTSLGITSAYLSTAASASRLITAEGATEIALIARHNFDKLGLKNIELVEGNFDNTLAGILENMSQINLAFIDGNHRKEPTERYFRQMLPKLNNDSILVFDDIHWSREMEEAWAAIKDHPSVRCTIDLFFIGIVAFRREFHEKQHFTIRF